MAKIERVYIACHRFFDELGLGPAIGGVETYIAALCVLLEKHQVETIVYQIGRRPHERRLTALSRLVLCEDFSQIFSKINFIHRSKPGLVIYSDQQCTPEHLEHPSVYIQHGVGWDLCSFDHVTPLKRPISRVLHRIRSYRLHRVIRRIVLEADCTICVDTMFRNWLQTTFPRDGVWGQDLHYVPNFADMTPKAMIDRKWQRRGNKTRCLFPRRFARGRGSTLFAQVVRSLASEIDEVEFAFVGEGPDRSEMTEILRGLDNIEIYSRPHAHMREEYSKAHLVVIPSLGNEGTSLSCIEAMGSGCAVVATTVGGLGNLILPDFNGVLCQPTVESFHSGVLRVLSDRSLMMELGQNAWRSATMAFSRDVWEKRVWGILSNLLIQSAL